MEMLKQTNRPQLSKHLKRVWLLTAVLLFAGCRICADCEDQAYPAYGGVWQRTIRDTGRVGSVFDPAGARAFDLASREQPEDITDQERQRYLEKEDGDSDSDTEEEDLDDEESGWSDEDEDRLRERQKNLRDRGLDDIENPKENEQRERKLDEIDVKILKGAPAPPVL